MEELTQKLMDMGLNREQAIVLAHQYSQSSWQPLPAGQVPALSPNAAEFLRTYPPTMRDSKGRGGLEQALEMDKAMYPDRRGEPAQAPPVRPPPNVNGGEGEPRFEAGAWDGKPNEVEPQSYFDTILGRLRAGRNPLYGALPVR